MEAFRESNFGIKPLRSRQEAVVRYLSSKLHLRSFLDVRRICRRLDPYLGQSQLREITGDVIWQITQEELKRGNQPATRKAGITDFHFHDTAAHVGLVASPGRYELR